MKSSTVPSNIEYDTSFDKTEVDEKLARCILRLWCVRSHKAAKAHYLEANNRRLMHKIFTYLNAISSIAVLFFTNAIWVQSLLDAPVIASTKNDDVVVTHYVVLAGLVGVLLVISTIIQFIQRDSERAEHHRFAGVEFSNLTRKIERNLSIKDPNMSLIHNLNRDYNHITRSYPLIASKTWDRAGRGGLNDQIMHLEAKLRKYAES